MIPPRPRHPCAGSSRSLAARCGFFHLIVHDGGAANPDCSRWSKAWCDRMGRLQTGENVNDVRHAVQWCCVSVQIRMTISSLSDVPDLRWTFRMWKRTVGGESLSARAMLSFLYPQQMSVTTSRSRRVRSWLAANRRIDGSAPGGSVSGNSSCRTAISGGSADGLTGNSVVA